LGLGRRVVERLARAQRHDRVAVAGDDQERRADRPHALDRGVAVAQHEVHRQERVVRAGDVDQAAERRAHDHGAGVAAGGELDRHRRAQRLAEVDDLIERVAAREEQIERRVGVVAQPVLGG
jgi:hypothetical protein